LIFIKIRQNIQVDVIAIYQGNRKPDRRALARVFWIHLLKVCWTFAGSRKHSISAYLSAQCQPVAESEALGWTARESRRPAIHVLHTDRRQTDGTSYPRLDLMVGHKYKSKIRQINVEENEQLAQTHRSHWPNVDLD